MKHTFKVRGMHCKSCAALIAEALQDEGARNVTVALDEKQRLGTVTAESSLAREKLAATIEEQGDYTVQ